MTRMGMIEHCNSANFNDVDGILGFGWADQPRSAALLRRPQQRDHRLARELGRDGLRRLVHAGEHALRVGRHATRAERIDER